MKLLDGIRFGLHVTGIVAGSLAYAVKTEWQRRKRTVGVGKGGVTFERPLDRVTRFEVRL
jgi:hypothetical protein